MWPLKIIFSVLVAMENMITEYVIKRAQKVLWQRRDSGRYRLNLRAVLHPRRAQRKRRHYCPTLLWAVRILADADMATMFWIMARCLATAVQKNSMNQNSANGFAVSWPEVSSAYEEMRADPRVKGSRMWLHEGRGKESGRWVGE